jgi:hypothetical protein
MQQESLQYAQKYLDVIKDTVSARAEGADLDRQIARRRAGIADNRYTQMADEIRAARERFQEALREANIRRATITLEFALLEAQRQNTLFNAKVQRAVLDQQLGQGNEMSKQLTAVINNITGAADALDQARQAAFEGVDLTVANARKAYELATIPDRRQDTMGGRRRGRIELANELSKGLYDGMSARPGGQNTHVAPLIDSQTKLITSTDNLAEINKQYLEQAKKTPAATGGAGAITGSGAGSNAAKFFMQRLGLTAEQAAGIAGNLQIESNFNPRAYKAEENAQGIAQWRGDRLQNFQKTMGKSVLASTLSEQLEFVAKELETKFGAVLRRLRNSSTAKDAAAIIDSGYEISSGAARGQRQTAANLLVSSLDDTTLAANIKQIAINTGRNNTTTPIKEITSTPIVPTTEEPMSGLQDIVGKLPDIKPQTSGLQDAIQSFNDITTTGPVSMLNVFTELGDKLGPQGTIIPNIIQGINTLGDNYQHFIDVLQYKDQNGKGASFGDKFEAGAQIALTALNMISSVSAAASDARVAGIDREIAAEQKRDGKSAESIAKIKSLEQKKDAIARKQFNMQKKMMMAQTIISTAAAIAGQLASPPVGPWNIALAAAMGALGAAQLAIIAGTSYQSTSSANVETATPPATVSVGNRGDQVNLAKNNPNAGGEIGYLRGSQGIGRNASDFAVIGSAYGGPIPRGYGNVAFATGERGPEIIRPTVPVTVHPSSDVQQVRPMGPVHFNIRAFDASDEERVLRNQRGNIIGMLREAANANGEPFMEDVNVHVYTNPHVSKL